MLQDLLTTLDLKPVNPFLCRRTLDKLGSFSVYLCLLTQVFIIDIEK